MHMLEMHDLGGSSPMDRVLGDHFVHRGVDEITELEENLDQLTLDILDVVIDDLPKRFQRHTVGLLGRFSRLLSSIARAILCYHENH